MYRLDQHVVATPRLVRGVVQAPGFARDLRRRVAYLTASLSVGLIAASVLALLIAFKWISRLARERRLASAHQLSARGVATPREGRWRGVIWSWRLERAHHRPALVAIDQPEVLALLEKATVNIETTHHQLRTSVDQVGPQPDWSDLLERVEQANESLLHVIARLG